MSFQSHAGLTSAVSHGPWGQGAECCQRRDRGKHVNCSHLNSVVFSSEIIACVVTLSFFLPWVVKTLLDRRRLSGPSRLESRGGRIFPPRHWCWNLSEVLGDPPTSPSYPSKRHDFTILAKIQKLYTKFKINESQYHQKPSSLYEKTSLHRRFVTYHAPHRC